MNYWTEFDLYIDIVLIGRMFCENIIFFFLKIDVRRW